MFATVAICTRNRSHTLADAVLSLVKQDADGEYEILIVDDGSTDATPAVAQRLAEEVAGPRIRYIRQDHQGLSNTRNRAVLDGHGELVCFVDDDAIADAGWLRAMVDGAERHPEIDCFAGRILLRLEGKAPRTCERESLAAELDLGTNEQPVARAKGANMAIRKSAFRRVGMFNPALVWRADEVDWQRRLNHAGGSVMYLPDALVWHRRLPDDLRWGRLLKTKFKSGIGEVYYFRESGRPVNYRRELRAIVRFLRHAARHRCPGGVFRAVLRMGIIWGGLRGELRKPRTEPPPYPQSESVQ